MSGLLVVTAVPAEAEAIRAGLTAPDETVTVVPVGVGPAVAAAATARLLALAEAAGRPYRAVVSAGIAGGFVGRVAVGGTVLADRSVAADLGAESPGGFIPVEDLGMPPELLGGGRIVPADPGLLAGLRAALPGATVGTVLTVSTVTGTAASTAALARTAPGRGGRGHGGVRRGGRRRPGRRALRRAAYGLQPDRSARPERVAHARGVRRADQRRCRSPLILSTCGQPCGQLAGLGTDGLRW